MTTVEYPDHWEMSPSSAKQWLNCSGSIKHPDYAQRSAEKDSGDTSHADRGTLGHAMVEAILGGPKLEKGHLEFMESMTPEALVHLKAAVETCVEFVRKRYGKAVQSMPPDNVPSLYLELKQKDDLIDEHGGTMDVCIVTPDVIDVTDFKFGRYYVDVDANEQIGCYLNLARQRFPGRKQFFGSIVQPYHHEGLTYEWTAGELDELSVDTLESSISNEFKASDEWCVWCPLLLQCQTAAEFVMEEIKDFPDLTNIVDGVKDRRPTAVQLDVMAKIYRVGKMAEDMTKGANKIIKRYAQLGADVRSVGLGIRKTPRLYWTEGALPFILAFTDKNGYDRQDVMTSPDLITPPAFRDLLGMDNAQFREEFGRFLDVRETEALTIGKECKQEFPEFTDLTH